MRTQKQRIFSILAILTMTIILTCIFAACGDSDTGAQDEKPSQAFLTIESILKRCAIKYIS